MIILENYRKTDKLLRKLGGLAKGFGFTYTVTDKVEEAVKDEDSQAEILELASKNEALEGENTTLTESNSQLVSELKTSKGELTEANHKIEELNKQLQSEPAPKEPRKRRTKAEMEADKEKETG